MKHIVMYSGGAGSWAAAARVAAQHGPEDLLLVFTDTRMEDPSLYRFLVASAKDVGGELVTLADGRTPWEVFWDTRFLGNTRVDPCSRILKRDLFKSWLQERYTPEDCILYVGIDWQEEHRWERMRERWLPYVVEAPLCESPLISKARILRDVLEAGLEMPALYQEGFPHNNCGGFCIKAGQAHFRLLLATRPDQYAWHEANEAALREHLGKDVAILRDRRGGKTRPLTMREFRERSIPEGAVDEYEWGGCGCFSDEEAEG